MEEVQRRDALRAFGALAAIPLIGLPSSTHSQPLDRKFAPPATPMRFSRSLIRELVGNAQIVVTRAWRVRFEPLGNGYSLSGEQIEVDVTVPPGLEALAELERRKVEAGMFPMMLSRSGLIMSDKMADAKPAVTLAIEHAAREIASRDLSSTDQSAAGDFLRTLQNSAQLAASKLPRDLFSPRDVSRADTRTLTLPGGATGEIEISFSAQTSEPLGLLSKAERTVTTRIGDSAKASTERWTLAQI
jgi:hypothetical protein